MEASSSETHLLPPFSSAPGSEAELGALAGGQPQLCLRRRVHRHLVKNNPVKSSGGSWEGRAISHSFPPSTHTHITATLLVWALEPAPKRSRFLRLRTPLSQRVTKPNILNQNLPSPLFPAPDKESISCPEPEPSRWPISATRLHNPFPRIWLLHNPGTLVSGGRSRARISLRIALHWEVISMHCVWGVFYVLSCFTSYLMQAKGQHGEFCFSISVPSVIRWSEPGSPCILGLVLGGLKGDICKSQPPHTQTLQPQEQESLHSPSTL